MAFLPAVGRKQIDVGDAGNPRAFALSPYYVGKPYKTGWDIERAVRDGVERVVAVFQSVDAIASNQIRLPVRVRRDNRETGEVIDDHFLARWLNLWPNRFEDAAAFRYRLSAQLLLSKRGAFAEIIRSNDGTALGLYLLPPQYTSPVPHATRFVDHFLVEMPGGGVKYKLAPEDVIWWRGKPHPTDPYSSLTPLEAAGLSVDIDFYAKVYNRRFLQNDGRPGGVLMLKGDFDDETRKEVKSRFGAGVENAGRIIPLKADDMKYVDTAISPRDGQYSELRKLTKEDIREAFGVPESLVNASGRTFDNAFQEKLNFWEETMETHVVFCERPLDRLDGQDDTFVDFDTDGVSVIQDAKQKREAGIRENIKVGMMTPEEAREATGRDPSGDPSLDQFFAPVGWVPIGARLASESDGDGGNPPKAESATSRPSASAS